jgi:hypothetical protein
MLAGASRTGRLSESSGMIVLAFTVCGALTGICEEHHVATEPGTGILACMLGAQATIANTTPLRGDQRVSAWRCSFE